VDTLDDYADLVCGNSLIYDENSIKPSEKMTFMTGGSNGYASRKNASLL
jgi:hypothetical protein